MHASIAALALSFPFIPVAGDPEPAFRCGLGKEFHAGRRAALRECVGEGVYLFRGLPATRDYTVFRQDKSFWYLTGIESPGAALVMDGESGREILFLPAAEPMVESWEGELWDAEDEWVENLTGFEDVRPAAELVALLDELVDQGEVVWTSLAAHVELAGASDRAQPYDQHQASDPLDRRPSRERALATQLEAQLGAQVKDCSPALDHYTSDITRTWPANGRFSERQAELYDAVLAAQLAGIAAARPGGTIGDVERACNAVLAERGFRKLTKHANCHLIGMEVHDVGDRSAVLVPGVAFTIEPGLYETSTGIGVRIEDVVVVTAEGCEVLTRDVPKERKAIEALVAEDGVLDWMDGDR